jgi:hypothetical protein
MPILKQNTCAIYFGRIAAGIVDELPAEQREVFIKHEINIITFKDISKKQVLVWPHLLIQTLVDVTFKGYTCFERRGMNY